MNDMKKSESAWSRATPERKAAIVAGAVGVVAAVVAFVAPDEVEYEDDTVHLPWFVPGTYYEVT